jgi:hypothetical protein
MEKLSTYADFAPFNRQTVELIIGFEYGIQINYRIDSFIVA